MRRKLVEPSYHVGGHATGAPRTLRYDENEGLSVRTKQIYDTWGHHSRNMQEETRNAQRCLPDYIITPILDDCGAYARLHGAKMADLVLGVRVINILDLLDELRQGKAAQLG